MKLHKKINEWMHSNYYKEWQNLAKRNYHGKRPGQRMCYENEYGEIKYMFISYNDSSIFKK